MNWSSIRSWLSKQWYLVGERPLDWLIAGAVFLLLFAVLRLLVAVAKRQLKCWSERSKTEWDDALCKALESTRGWFLFVVSAYFALLIPNLRESVRPTIRLLAVLALLFQAALWRRRFWSSNSVVTSANGWKRTRLRPQPSRC